MPPKTKLKQKRYAPVLQLPPLSTEEFDGLRASISVHGVLVPILLTEDGRVIDGTRSATFCRRDFPSLYGQGSCGEKTFPDLLRGGSPPRKWLDLKTLLTG